MKKRKHLQTVTEYVYHYHKRKPKISIHYPPPPPLPLKLFSQTLHKSCCNIKELNTKFHCCKVIFIEKLQFEIIYFIKLQT